MTGVAYRAPVRVDLAGGTLDVVPLYALLGTCTTVNAAIRSYVRVDLRRRSSGGVRVRRDDGGRADGALFRHVLGEVAPGAWEVTYASGVPAGSGLGGSSALVICLLACLADLGRVPRSRRRLVDMAADLEAGLIRAPTGRQDYIAAVWGGVQAVTFGHGTWSRVPLRLVARGIEGTLWQAPTGISHRSAAPNWRIVRRAVEGDARTLRSLAGIRAAGELAARAGAGGEMAGVRAAIRDDWTARRALGPFVSTPAVDRAIASLAAAGIPARLCGAGAGGTLLAAPPPGRAAAAVRILAGAGFRASLVRVARTGLRRVGPSGGGQ